MMGVQQQQLCVVRVWLLYLLGRKPADSRPGSRGARPRRTGARVAHRMSRGANFHSGKRAEAAEEAEGR